MKLLSLIMSLAILLAGCYTNTTLTKDSTLNLDNKDIIFYRTDGTSIKSNGGQHHRRENGYQVTGKTTLLADNSYHYWKDFDGIVLDETIKDISISEYDSNLTIIAVGETVLVLGGIVALVIWDNVELSSTQ